MVRKHREYDNDYPSVTQILGLLRKPALEGWYIKNTPEFIRSESAKGKEIGTAIHQAIQDHIELNEVKCETEYATEVTNALKSFMLFKKECPHIKLIKAEIKMTSQMLGLNGTTDVLADDGQLCMGDWKTGKCGNDIKPTIYDEYIHQVACYTKMYNELHGTDIKKAWIVSLAKDAVAYNLREVTAEEIEGSFNNVILPLLTIWKYTHQTKEDGCLIQ